jgi:hypothetical protein
MEVMGTQAGVRDSLLLVERMCIIDRHTNDLQGMGDVID